MEKRKRGGQPKPAELRKTMNITFRVTQSLHAKLLQEANEAELSISRLIQQRLTEYDRAAHLAAEIARHLIKTPKGTDHAD